LPVHIGKKWGILYRKGISSDRCSKGSIEGGWDRYYTETPLIKDDLYLMETIIFGR